MSTFLVALLLLSLGVSPATRPTSRPADLSADAEAVRTTLQPLIVRDDTVQSELQLRPEQQAAISKLLDKVETPLWLARDLPAQRRLAKARPLMQDLEAGLSQVLDAGQRERFEQVLLQYRGPTWLSQPEMAKKLALSQDQQQRIREIIDKTRTAFQKLDELARAGHDRTELEQLAKRLRPAQAQSLLEVLTPSQKQQWEALAGKPFDTHKVRGLAFTAPELRDATEWINSEPLTMAGLRGKVVVVHFWTFGCSNCIHNFPAYKAWQKLYAPKGVTIIGIHTPETKGEEVVDSVRAKARQHGLLFPILIDNDRKNWDAWGNNVWPAVYLVDKKGYVRYWWYGELNWQRAGGPKLMNERIQQLLAEEK